MSTAPGLVSTSSVDGHPSPGKPIRNGIVATAVVVDVDLSFGGAGGSDESLHVFNMEEADMGPVERKSLHLSSADTSSRRLIDMTSPDVSKSGHVHSLPYCGSVGLGKPSKRRAAGTWAVDIEYRDGMGHRRATSIVTRTADCLCVLAGGLATVVILNFNQAQGTCLAVKDDPRWLPMLPLLPQQLRCPSTPLYVTAIATYSAAGLCQIVREPRYWADCALLAALGSVVVGALYGVSSMLDALILGGFLSLVCCKGIAVWSAGRAD